MYPAGEALREFRERVENVDEGNRNIVMLVLCRKVIAQLIVEAIEKRSGTTVFAEYDYSNVGTIAAVHKPDIALIEIPERRGTPALDILDVCAEINKAVPGCKIMLLCPDKDKGSIDVCVKAKKKSQIEDFMFYEAGVEYLASKLEAMLPM